MRVNHAGLVLKPPKLRLNYTPLRLLVNAESSNGSTTTLRSLSQGRAANSTQFSHFSAVDQATCGRLYPLFVGHPQQ